MHFADKISAQSFLGLRLKTFSILSVIFLVTFQEASAQISDDFSDSNLTTDPTWYGQTDDYVINAAEQLQLQALTAGSSWLSTEATVYSHQKTRWELYIKQSFAGSGANYSRFYLMSDQRDLSGPLNGYFLQFGEAGSLDAVSLFRQTGTEVRSICRAAEGAIASAFAIRVQVRRDENGYWELLIDYTGESNFVLEGFATDNTHQSSLFAGLLCTYTITNASRFVYDDLLFNVIDAPDISPPSIDSVKVTSPNTVVVYFSEEIDSLSAEDETNYSLLERSEDAEAALLRPDHRSVLLTFSSALENGVATLLHVDAICDHFKNILAPTDLSILFFHEMPTIFRDIIITEIFPDPSPQITLPAAEYVELHNRSANPVQLGGWILSDGATSGLLPEYILMPRQYVVLSIPSAVPEFQKFGMALPVFNFPTLNNQGDKLRLLNSKEVIIDSVNYVSAWYRDEDKASGGWSLEIIDPEKACAPATNWNASEDLSGGTPGSRNSIYASVPDTQGPKLLDVVQVTDSEIKLLFDEAVSSAGLLRSNFVIDPHIEVIHVSFGEDPSLSEIRLGLGSRIDSTRIYLIRAVNISDCAGNLIQQSYQQIYLKADKDAPAIQSIAATSESSVSLTFSERVELQSGQSILHYELRDVGYPEAAVLSHDHKTVVLQYSSRFPNGFRQHLRVWGVTDVFGNAMSDTIVSFLYFKPSPVYFKDILFTEILADPSPPVGLPESEYVELYNRSTNSVDLAGWTFSDENTTVVFEHYLVHAGEYVIVTGQPAKFSGNSNVLALPLPSLNNAGDILTLKDPHGHTVDSVAYKSSWYGNDEARDGGWSLELIDPDNVCAGDRNWTASESESGGTPGVANSVLATMPDHTGPILMSVGIVDSVTIRLSFNETLQSGFPSGPWLSFEPHMEVSDVSFTDATLQSMTVNLVQPIMPGKSYTVHTSHIYDCAGNPLQPEHSSATFILPEKAQPGDIVINEVLFNPWPTGVDFVEVCNRSPRIIDLRNWTISNIISGEYKSTVISADRSIIQPMEHRAFTRDANILKSEYVSAVEENIRQSDLPHLNDNNGYVLIRDNAGVVMDSVYYSEEMHHPFVRNAEGVSLERVSLLTPASESSNWTSASSVAGFATPGYLNSNTRTNVVHNEAIIVEPEILQLHPPAVTFARIGYHFDQGGLMANVWIIDQQGRKIRQIAANELLGTDGFFRWDGDLENGGRARMGYYLVWFEIFDINGARKTFKKRLAIF